MATIKKNFYHAGVWYFPGDEVTGTAENAARSAGCLGNESKMMTAAPENKAIEENEDGSIDD